MARPLYCACALAALVTAPGAAQEPEPRPNFSSESELVVLHVAVKDNKGGYVGGLEQTAFRVSENTRPQHVSFFNDQDAPVTVGLLIDSSGSMAASRDLVIAASMAFSKAMNRQDEFFVLGFNDDLHMPLPPERPFTQSEPHLRVALVQAIKAIGRTALYNAVDAGLRHVQKGEFERQVLVILSDGGDNASSVTRAEVLTRAQASNALIYTIALVDPMNQDADPGFLSELSQATGGMAFRPKNVREVDSILQRVARDIRSMYTIGYVPAQNLGSARGRKEELRRVSVDVRSATGQKLDVRTRRAYLANGAWNGDDR